MVLYIIKRYLTTDHAKVIYYSMIHSKIKYGISVYGLTNQNNVNKLQVIQNKLLKILLNKNYRYSTNRTHNELGVLKISELITQEICTFVCNYLNDNLPEAFSGYFQTFNEVHSYNTRENSTRLQVPTHKHDISANTVKIKGSTIWNNQSPELRSIKNPKTFRKAFKDTILPYETT